MNIYLITVLGSVIFTLAKVTSTEVTTRIKDDYYFFKYGNGNNIRQPFKIFYHILDIALTTLLNIFMLIGSITVGAILLTGISIGWLGVFYGSIFKMILFKDADMSKVPRFEWGKN